MIEFKKHLESLEHQCRLKELRNIINKNNNKKIDKKKKEIPKKRNKHR